jgi:hypothetical protein
MAYAIMTAHDWIGRLLCTWKGIREDHASFLAIRIDGKVNLHRDESELVKKDRK